MRSLIFLDCQSYVRIIPNSKRYSNVSRLRLSQDSHFSVLSENVTERKRVFVIPFVGL